MYVLKDRCNHTLAFSGNAFPLTLAPGLCLPGVIRSAKGHGLLCVCLLGAERKCEVGGLLVPFFLCPRRASWYTQT